MINILRELVEIRSDFPNEEKIGEYLYNALTERGFEVEVQKVENGRTNILGKKGSGTRVIGFYGHMDTVPVQGEWQADPFKLRIENGKAIGLGAYDMKAGIASILKITEDHLNCEVRVAFCVDEENNSLGGYHLLQKEFFKGCDLVIVPEINDSPIEGEGIIMLGRRGRVRYNIKVFGKSCHGATGDGINAIVEASRLVQELEKMENFQGEHMKGSQFVSSINAKARSLSYPEEAILEMDVHLVNGESQESVLKRIERIIENSGINARVEVAIRDVPYLMPYWTNKENLEVQKLSKIVEKEMGRVVYSYGKSVADECFIAQMAPIVSIGPLGGNPHTGEEWVSLESLEKLTKIFKEFTDIG